MKKWHIDSAYHDCLYLMKKYELWYEKKKANKTILIGEQMKNYKNKQKNQYTDTVFCLPN